MDLLSDAYQVNNVRAQYVRAQKKPVMTTGFFCVFRSNPGGARNLDGGDFHADAHIWQYDVAVRISDGRSQFLVAHRCLELIVSLRYCRFPFFVCFLISFTAGASGYLLMHWLPKTVGCKRTAPS